MKQVGVSIKLYFIIGLPYEEVEDCVAIADLAQKIADEYFAVPKNIRKKGLKVTVSTSILVPNHLLHSNGQRWLEWMKWEKR